MTVESQTDPRPSLAELKKNYSVPYPEGKVEISWKTFLALLAIAEAAQALDTALLHDAVAGDAAKLTLDDLDEALSKVKQ